MGKFVSSSKELKNKSSEELASSNIYSTRDKNGWKDRAVKNGLADDTVSPSSSASDSESKQTSGILTLFKMNKGFIVNEKDFPTLQAAAQQGFKPK